METYGNLMTGYDGRYVELFFLVIKLLIYLGYLLMSSYFVPFYGNTTVCCYRQIPLYIDM